MSPRVRKSKLTDRRFPRVSGDEPDARYVVVNGDEFSPRERG